MGGCVLLPSLCEGSATAVYEALAAGLPVICTPNTGSVVRHGIDGYIVPIRDVHETAQILRQLADNPALLARMSESARERVLISPYRAMANGWSQRWPVTTGGNAHENHSCHRLL